jgi:hypothetical protein
MASYRKHSTSYGARQQLSRDAAADKQQIPPKKGKPETNTGPGTPMANVGATVSTLSKPAQAGMLSPSVVRNSLYRLQRSHGNRYVRRMLQRSGDDGGEVTPDVERAIESSRGSGQPLHSGVQSRMGQALDADFSGVRVHTDSEADGLNRSLQARAFTTGKDVYFRQGEYNPGSSSGRELLAHELTHVVQQGGSAVRSKNEADNTEPTCSGCSGNSTIGTLQTKLTLGAPNDVYEQEADSVASAYVNWERQPVAKDNAGSHVRRQVGEQEKKEQMIQTKPDASRLSRQPEEEEEKEPLQAKSGDSYLRPQPKEKEEEQIQANLAATLVQQQPEEEEPKEPVQAKTEVDELQRQSEYLKSAPFTALSSLRSRKRNIQRLRVPLDGWGGTWAGDDSYMSITPRAKLFVGGAVTQQTRFPAQRDRMRIPLNTTAHLQISANIHVFQDNNIDNGENDWSFQYTWGVRVDNRGTLQLDPPTRSWSGGAGDAPWSVEATPIQGTRSVGLAFTLGSTEGSSSSHTIPVEVGGAVKPFGVGVEVAAGYEYSWGSSTGSTLTAGRGFVLDLDTPPPPPPRGEVEFGPVTLSRTTDFSFETSQPNMRGRVDHVSRIGPEGGLVAMSQSELRRWFLRLDEETDPFRQRGAGLTILVEGHASPRGEEDPNGRLAHRRIEYMIGLAREVLPGASVRSNGVLGESPYSDRPGTENNPQQRIARVRVIDRRESLTE